MRVLIQLDDMNCGESFIIITSSYIIIYNISSAKLLCFQPSWYYNLFDHSKESIIPWQLTGNLREWLPEVPQLNTHSIRRFTGISSKRAICKQLWCLCPKLWQTTASQ